MEESAEIPSADDFEFLVVAYLSSIILFTSTLGYMIQYLRFPTIHDSSLGIVIPRDNSFAQPSTPDDPDDVLPFSTTKDPAHLLDILIFPGKGYLLPCMALEMYGTCSKARRGECYKDHGISSAKKLQNYLSRAKKTVDIAAQGITSHQIAEILAKLHRQGLQVRIIRDYENLRMLLGTEKVSSLETLGILMKVNARKKNLHDKDVFTCGIFHHKFIIIDEEILIHGSSNFTLAGAMTNFEDVVVHNISDVVRHFAEHFEHVWRDFTHSL